MKFSDELTKSSAFEDQSSAVSSAASKILKSTSQNLSAFVGKTKFMQPTSSAPSSQSKLLALTRLAASSSLHSEIGVPRKNTSSSSSSSSLSSQYSTATSSLLLELLNHFILLEPFTTPVTKLKTWSSLPLLSQSLSYPEKLITVLPLPLLSITFVTYAS